MNTTEKIKPQDFPQLWKRVEEWDQEVCQVARQNSSCSKIGHIAFNLVLAILGFFLGLWAVSTEGIPGKSWCTELGTEFKALLMGITGEMNGLTVLIVIAAAVVLLLAIPFIASAICWLICRFTECDSYRYQAPTGTPPIKNAEMLLKKTTEIAGDKTGCFWDDYYPMNEIGDLIEINAYNFIPWLCILLPMITSFFLGYQLPTSVLIRFSILSALLAFLLLLVIVPLWKLSSIINAVFLDRPALYGLEALQAELTAFIEDYKKAEEERLEHQRRYQEEEKLKKAEALYAKATETDDPDMKMLKEAADMGSLEACLEYGKILYLDSVSGKYTRNEREKICKKAADFLEKSKSLSAEAEFLWLGSRLTYESNSIDGWQKMLEHARTIQASGELPEHFDDAMDSLIQTLVQQIDGMSTKQATKRGRFYCRFYNAGICNHQSNEYFIYKCTDPVNQSCSYAMLNNGIAYEEY